MQESGGPSTEEIWVRTSRDFPRGLRRRPGALPEDFRRAAGSHPEALKPSKKQQTASHVFHEAPCISPLCRPISLQAPSGGSQEASQRSPEDPRRIPRKSRPEAPPRGPWEPLRAEEVPRSRPEPQIGSRRRPRGHQEAPSWARATAGLFCGRLRSQQPSKRLGRQLHTACGEQTDEDEPVRSARRHLARSRPAVRRRTAGE